MSSYLSTLAARALEQPQSIKPRLASLFEPAGPRVRWLEAVDKKQRGNPRSVTEPHQGQSPTPRPDRNEASIEARPAAIESDTEVIAGAHKVPNEPSDLRATIKRVPEPVAQPQHAPTLAKPVEEESENEGNVAVEVSKQSEKEPQAALAVDQRQGARAEPRPATEITRAIAFEKTVVTEQGGQRPSQPGPVLETGKARPEAARSAAVIIRPEVTAGRPQPRAMELPAPTQEAPSSIRITIGRVDVRAIMPQSQPAAPAARKTASGALSLDEYLKKRNGA